MPTYDDFDGVWFTIQSLRLYHPEVNPSECEILVVDNNPGSAHGKHVRDFATSWCGDIVRVHPLTDATGSAAAKDCVFREARGEIVICMDCHVLLEPGAIGKLLEYYNAYPDTKNLLSGPLVYDNLMSLSTHFDDVWRTEMWGIWGTDDRGKHRDSDPFEIPAMGMGVVSCRKEAWPGFHSCMRGFGGEEWYIHEKIRAAGANCMCLPAFRWVHRFGRPNGVKYPLTRRDKVWNYVVGFSDLGRDLAPVHKHFVVDNTYMSQNEFDGIVSEVKKQMAHKPCCGEPAKPSPPAKVNGVETLDELYSQAVKTPSDVNEHCAKLKELAGQCDHVAEFGMRPLASSVALLAGKPKRFVCYSKHPDAQSLYRYAGDTRIDIIRTASLDSEVEKTDLLFLDTVHTADQFLAELRRYAPKVRRWIARHDTAMYGEKGEDGGPGLLVGLRAFLTESPEWSVVYHTQNQYGLTVIGKQPQDKPELPGVVQIAGTFAKAIANHVMNGAENVSQGALMSRLKICTLCKQLTDRRCAACGCYVDLKAPMASEDCPLGNWR